MATFRFNPDQRIPNDPFYYPEGNFLQSAAGPLIVGTGLSINYSSSIISATGGGGGGGSITSIAAGAGISISSPAGPVPVVSLLTSGVVAGTYFWPSAFQVDQYGRLISVTAGTGAPNTTVVSPITNAGTALAPVIGIQDANSLQKGAVRIGANICSSAGVISVCSASTAQAGVVQLYDNTNLNNPNLALTAAAGYDLQQQINGLAFASNLVFAGTFNSSTGNIGTPSSDGIAAGFASGAPLPAATPAIDDYFVISTFANPSYTPPGGGGPYNVNQGDWFIANGTTGQWDFVRSSSTTPTATTTSYGTVCLATLSETQAGTPINSVVTAATAKATYIPLACLTAKGTIVGASAAGVAIPVPVGTNGQTLVACAASASGLCWTTPTAAIPCSVLTAKGTLITTATPTTPIALPVGADGTVLVACSLAGPGLCWTTAPYIPCSCITAKGTLITGTGANAPVPLAVGTNGQTLVACSTSPNGLCWASSAVSPATPITFGTVLGCTTATNAALGCNAFLANGGTGNVAIGLDSLRANASGVNNVAIGNGAFCANTGGSGNVAIGSAALKSVTNDSRIVAIGEQALCASTGGTYNVALGWSAMCSQTSGGSNVAIGPLAGNNITTGNSNVVIGPNVTVPNPAGDTQLAIGYNLGQCWITGDSSKNVKFWAGIRANDDSLGTSGQVLTSTGTGVAWTSASGVGNWVGRGTFGNPLSTIPFGTSTNSAAVLPGSYNGVWTQQVGPKIWNIIYQYRADGTAAAWGGPNADFVFALPSGLNFDLTLPFQNAFTGNVETASHYNRGYFLPGASSTQFNAGGGTGSENGSGIVPWSGNTFRFFITSGANGAPRAWGTNYWNNVDTWINIGFQFQTP
jgi:hypothetical protein